MRINYKLIFNILTILFISGQVKAQVLGATRRPNDVESIYPEISPIFVQKLVDTAIKYYPQLKVRRAQVGMATSDWKQAKGTWFETLSITPSYVYNPSQSINLFNSTGASTNFFTGYQIAFSLNISSFFTRPHAVKKAKQAIDVARFEEETSINTLKTQVKILYTNYQLAKANERQAIQQVSSLGLYNESLKLEYQKADAKTPLTVLTAGMTTYNAAVTTKVAAEAAVLIAKYNLEELLGKRLEDIK